MSSYLDSSLSSVIAGKGRRRVGSGWLSDKLSSIGLGRKRRVGSGFLSDALGSIGLGRRRRVRRGGATILGGRRRMHHRGRGFFGDVWTGMKKAGSAILPPIIGTIGPMAATKYLAPLLGLGMRRRRRVVRRRRTGGSMAATKRRAVIF